MHVVHLALAPDAICSMLMDWSDDTTYVLENSREKRFGKLWDSYRQWCEECGIVDRAQKKLFSVSILKSEGKYIDVSQKTLSAGI